MSATSLFKNSSVFLPFPLRGENENIQTIRTQRRSVTTACTAGMRDEAHQPIL